MTSGEMSKRIQLHKQGPDGVPAVMASKPFIDGMNSLLYQTNVGRITLLSDEGKVLRNYPIVSPEGHFMAFLPCSYFYTPTFVKDSVLFVAPKISKSSIKKEEWVTIPMFFGLNLNTGKIDYLPINYPPITIFLRKIYICKCFYKIYFNNFQTQILLILTSKNP